MQIRTPGSFLLSIVLPFILLDCATQPRTFKDALLDDYYPILTEAQQDSLRECVDEQQAARYLEAFWSALDSASVSPPGALRDEYLQRLQFANEHFPDRRGTGRSDQKRIYLMYGPPDDVESFETSNISLGTFTRPQSLQIWFYYAPEEDGHTRSLIDAYYPGMKKFVFADLTGRGNYVLLFSSDQRSDIDLRWLQVQ